MALEIKTTHQLAWLDASKNIRPTAIVLHWWGEPINEHGIQYLHDLLEKRQLSVQYAVLRGGETYQLSPAPTTFCRHAKCANNSAIGIEIEGHNADDLEKNPAQFDAVIQLVRHLVQTFAIETEFRVEGAGEDMRFYGIASHKQVDVFCPNANGKDDVHDEYMVRVIKALS